MVSSNNSPFLDKVASKKHNFRIQFFIQKKTILNRSDKSCCCKGKKGVGESGNGSTVQLSRQTISVRQVSLNVKEHQYVARTKIKLLCLERTDGISQRSIHRSDVFEPMRPI
jgi:hypothetical protein